MIYAIKICMVYASFQIIRSKMATAIVAFKLNKCDHQDQKNFMSTINHKATILELLSDHHPETSKSYNSRAVAKTSLNGKHFDFIGQMNVMMVCDTLSNGHAPTYQI